MPIGWMVPVGITFTRVLGKVLKKHGTTIAVGGLTATEIFDLVRNEVPDSDEESITEVVTAITRIMDEDQTMWAEDRMGKKIPLNYITFNVKQGTSWVTSKYRNKNTENAAYKRGFRAGQRAAQRELQQRGQIYQGVN